MLMSFMRHWVQLLFPIYFKRVYFSGIKNLPKNEPFLLACNHPNSFLDAVVIALYRYQPIHFLVRGDVFKKSAANYILRKLRMIPIYRREEGVDNLAKNDLTFQECFKLFESGESVLIFSEGKCVAEKRMRPLKKGTARLALEAANRQNFKTDFKVYPTGVNYTYGDRWGTEAFVIYGKGISMKEYEQLYLENPAKAVLDLTLRLEEEIEKLVIITPDPTHDDAVEAALLEARQNYKMENKWMVKESNARFELEKNIAATTTQKPSKAAPAPKRDVLFYLAFPIYLIGYALHYLPAHLSNSMTNQKVRLIEFKASVRFSTALFLGTLYYLIVVIPLLFVIFPIKIAFLLLAAMLLVGYLSGKFNLRYYC